jgi:YfiH family protein
MVLREHNGIVLGVFPPLEILAPELVVAITTRVGGISNGPYRALNLGDATGDLLRNVRRNRKMLLDSLGIPARRVARAEQVHGAGIAVITRPGTYRGIDGLITDRKNISLVISTADCYPLVVYAPAEKVLAALHVGRNGAAGGIIERAFVTLHNRFAIDTEHTIALIGPGICERCYTVWKRTARRFPAQAVRYGGGKWHLDLSAFCKGELIRHGVRRKNIFSAHACTACNPDLYFSHQRDRGVTGRHWTVATIHPL